jgi:ribonuclease R
MRQFVGQEFEATVTGVQPYGCFVELDNGAEGLLHVRELPGYYRYDEEHLMLIPDRGNAGRSRSLYKVHPSQLRPYRIGDKVTVKLIRINEEKRALDFGVGGL